MKLKDWERQQGQPFRQAVAEATHSGEGEQQRLMGQLQGVVALLLDNKPRQAVTVWNSLQLQPSLQDARLTQDGVGVWLTPADGDPVRLELDEVIADLERLLAGRAALDS